MSTFGIAWLILLALLFAGFLLKARKDLKLKGGENVKT